jgi:dCMP deaminase
MDSYDRLSNREIKYEMIVHAEINAILFARQDLRGMTLYTTPFMPCSRCASLIIQAGISKVVSYSVEENPRWKDSISLAKELFDEAEVELILLEKIYNV